MKKFTVYGTATISLTMEVEVGDDEGKEEAIDKAAQEYPGLSGYCGNGASHGRLIGHTCEELEIEVNNDADVDWTEADEIEDE